MNTVIDTRIQQPEKVHKRLSQLISRTWQQVPAYRALWRKAGLDETHLPYSLVDEFQRLPIVTKHDLKRFSLRERCDQSLSLQRIYREFSGGATGEPFEIPLNASTKLRRQWRFLRALMMCGYRPGRRLMMLNTRRSSWLTRVANWSCVDLTLGERELAKHYLRFLPEVVYGPLNTLKMLARGLKASRNPVTAPKAVISTAEQMSVADREYLRDAFGSDPADMYGMSECGLLAWRAGGQNNYEVASDAFLLEFVPCESDARLERLIVTDLSGGAMPLIRFDTGDLVIREQSPGKPITDFSGREVDCLRLPDETVISPYRVTLALESVGDIERYRVVQRADLSLDVELWVDSERPEAVLNRAGKVLVELVDDTLPVQIKSAEGPPPVGLRKFRPVRSEAGVS